MKRFAAIDFGTVRMGIAVSDERHFLARPLPFVRAGRTLQESAEALYAQLIKHGPLEALIIGLPLHMNGKESALSLQVRELAPLLESLFNIPVILWDERLSTAQVERSLKEMELSRKQRSVRVDSDTAAAILQNYLDSKQG